MTKTTEPKIVIACRTGVPSDLYPELEFAVVTVSITSLTRLLKFMGVAEMLKNMNNSFHRCSFFECGPQYYRTLRLEDNADISDADEAEMERDLDQGEWIVLPAGWVAPVNPPDCEIGKELVGRTECNILNVGEDFVLWTCYPRHADTPQECESQILTQAKITDLLGQLHVPTVRHEREQRVIQL